MADVEIIQGELPRLASELESVSASVAEAAHVASDLAVVAAAMPGGKSVSKATAAGQSVDDQCREISDRLVRDADASRAADRDFIAMDEQLGGKFAAVITDSGYSY